VAAATAIAAVAVATWRDPDVPADDFALGLALGAVGFAGLPAGLYFSLGRFVRNPLVVGGVWLVSLAPLGLYLVLVALMTASLVACPPDAYECPV
jgi:hypothetical protein